MASRNPDGATAQFRRDIIHAPRIKLERRRVRNHDSSRRPNIINIRRRDGVCATKRVVYVLPY